MYITNRNEIFPQDVVDEAIKHTREDWENESCGAVIDGEYVRFQNEADDKSNTFLIQDTDFTNAYIDGKVEAVIHSHNNYPMASQEDQQQQVALDVPFGIINFKNGSVTHVVFWGDSLPMEPLEGREFFYGAWDCYGLVRDWLRINTGMLPPSPAREFPFWHKGISMFENFIEDGTMPFYYVDEHDIQPGDILLYNIYNTKYVNHCGVYLNNDGETLHHLYNKLSGRYPIMHNRQYLMKVMRHNPKWQGYRPGSNWEKENDKIVWSFSEAVS